MIFIYITSTDPVHFAVMFRTHSRSISKIYDLPSPLCRSHSREPFCHMSHHTPKRSSKLPPSCLSTTPD